MRLFVAVDLDQPLRARVAAIIAALRERAAATSGRVGWVTPDRLHLTLQFIGHVPDAVALDIRERLAAPFAVLPFDLSLGPLGMFPPRGRPRVIWLGVHGGRAQLAALHDEVAGRLADLDFRRESRPFSPHLTLGRFRELGLAADRDRLAAADPPGAGGCRIARVTLYESRLSPRGPTYTPLQYTPFVAPEGR